MAEQRRSHERRAHRVAVAGVLALLAVGCASPPPGAGPTGPGSSVGSPPSPGTTAVRFAPGGAGPAVAYPSQSPDVPWPTATWPEAPLPEGVDAARLEAALAEAFGPLSGGPGRNIDAVVAVHAGRIVVERYRAGFGDGTTIHRSWSMAKSVNQALVGVLVREGRLDVRAPAPVPQWSDPADPRHGITTDQLLRMASGLAWKEDYFAADSDTIAMLVGTGRQDMAAYAAAKPLDVAPDTRVQYSTGGACIVSGVVGSVVGHGDAYRAFMRRELLEPLGIDEREVAAGFDGAGNFVGGSVFDTTARNFAKFGLLYLRDGVWDGRRILPEGWVDYARTPTPAPAGIPTYGAGWWIKKSDPTRFEAGGFGGQHIVVDPSKDLVVVVLADRLDGREGQIRDEVVDAFAGVTGGGTGSATR